MAQEEHEAKRPTPTPGALPENYTYAEQTTLLLPENQTMCLPFYFVNPGCYHNDPNALGLGENEEVMEPKWDWEEMLRGRVVVANRSLGAREAAQIRQYKAGAMSVWRYGSPIILSAGSVGNLLSVLLICRKRILHSTTSVYLLVLAGVDTGSLYSGLLHLYVKHVYAYDWRVTSTAACKLHLFGSSVLLQYGAWLLVSVTLERLCAVFLPHKCKDIFSKRNALLGLALQAVLIVAINAHYLVTHQLLSAASSGMLLCAPPTNSQWYFTHYVWPWLDLCVSSLLPSVLLLLCNSAILCRIGRAQALRRRQLHAHTGGGGAKMTSMTAILLTVSLVFLLSTAPLAVFMLRNVVLQLQADAVQRAQYGVLWAALNMLLYTNNSINFLLYLLSGPRFRQEFSRLLCSKTNAVHPAPPPPPPPPQPHTSTQRRRKSGGRNATAATQHTWDV